MLPLEPIIARVDELLASGVTKRGDIVATISSEFEDDVDHDELVRTYFDKRVALAITRLRDDDGERVAFPGRDEDGERVVIHMEHSADPTLMRASGERMRQAGKAMVRAGDRLIERAEQLEIDFHRAAA